MKNIFLLALSSFIIFASCKEIFAKRIRGNGNVVTRSRTPEHFSTIHLSGGNIDVYARQDSAAAVTVEADENLQDYVEIYFENDVMRIRPKEGYRLTSRERIKVHIAAPAFKHFESSGAGNIYTEGKLTSSEPVDFDMSGSSRIQAEVDAPKITAELSGAGNVNLKGQTKDLNVSVSGSADIRCFELMAENVDVQISGAGDAEVFASVRLNAHVSGAGDIRYKGNPTITKQISGAGSLKKVD